MCIQTLFLFVGITLRFQWCCLTYMSVGDTLFCPWRLVSGLSKKLVLDVLLIKCLPWQIAATVIAFLSLLFSTILRLNPNPFFRPGGLSVFVGCVFSSCANLTSDWKIVTECLLSTLCALSLKVFFYQDDTFVNVQRKTTFKAKHYKGAQIRRKLFPQIGLGPNMKVERLNRAPCFSNSLLQ